MEVGGAGGGGAGGLFLPFPGTHHFPAVWANSGNGSGELNLFASVCPLTLKKKNFASIITCSRKAQSLQYTENPKSVKKCSRAGEGNVKGTAFSRI